MFTQSVDDRPDGTGSALGSAGRRGRARSAARLVRRFAAARLRGRPFILSHLLTGRCNARCPTCLWREDVSPGGEELTTSEVLQLYRAAGRAGLAQLVVWGGEPTLRADLPRLVHGGREAGLLVTLISNGRRLPRLWPCLRGAVDTLILSVDDVGPAHDRIRGLDGLFEDLSRFAAALDRDPQRPRLILNTVMSRANADALPRVSVVARAWGAGLYFCPMETGRMTSRGFEDELGGQALPPEALAGIAREALRLKDRGFPLLSTRRYLEELARNPALTGYSCRVPSAILTVEADGSVRDCLRRDVPLADVRALLAGGGLEPLFQSRRYRAMVGEGRGCTVCSNPDVIETSWLWELRPRMLVKVAALARL